jgi:hypothetical protein
LNQRASSAVAPTAASSVMNMPDFDIRIARLLASWRSHSAPRCGGAAKSVA